MKPTSASSIADLKAMGQRLRQARRALNLSQGDVAKATRIKQSAVSAFENGHTDAVSSEKLTAWKSYLEVNTNSDVECLGPTGKGLAICINSDCPSLATGEGDRQVRRPRAIKVKHNQTYCPECGDTLHGECPNPNCLEAVNEGAYCMSCGKPYVP